MPSLKKPLSCRVRLLIILYISTSSSSPLPISSLQQPSSPSSSSSPPGYDLKTYQADTSELQKVVFDGRSSKFYLGGTNKILSLDLNLLPLQQVSTGPVLDDMRCTRDFGLQSCGDESNAYETTLTNNFNKVLLIDRDNRQLISCGSIFQGTCQSRPLSDLSKVTEGHLEDPEYFLTTNDDGSSTVAFIGPGFSGSSTLYVASSRPIIVPPRDVPTVSSRSLSHGNKFKLSNPDGLEGGSFVKFRQDMPDWFKVTYVGGFGYEGFSYFFTNQIMYTSELEVKKETEEISKLIQVCQEDRHYFSYVEAPMMCRRGELEYELMTSGVLLTDPGKEVKASLGSRSSDAILVASFTNRTRDGSALCLFSMSDVRKVLVENFNNCFTQQQKYLGLQFGTKLCRRLGTEISEDYCGEAENNGPLVGTIPIVGGYNVQWNGLEITSMTYTVVQEHTVLFLTTNTGHIKKVLIRGMGLLSEYEDIGVNEGHPLTNIIIISTSDSTTKTSVAFLSENKVYLLGTSECSRYSTCESCRGAKDPHCGWCSLENKCSLKTECLDSDNDNRWLSYNTWECIHIPRQFVNPVHISVRKTEQITIGVKVLPIVTPPHSFVCVFSDSSPSSVSSSSSSSVSSSLSSSSSSSLSSPAQVSTDEVRCSTPRNLNLFFTHSSIDQVNLTLSIESSQTKVKFLNTSLTLFDCSRLRSCLKCTRSKFNCLWCVTSHACSQHDESTCPDEFFLKTPQTCPQLEGRSSMDDILIPVHVPTSLNIPALYLPLVKNEEYGYECLVHVTTPPVRVPAIRISPSLVVCEAYSYSYEGDDARKLVTLEVVYNNNFYIDDNNALTVQLYKCEMMADDCSSCLNLEEASPRLSCVWCDGSCKNKNTCIHGNSITCPNPVINEVSPSSGPTQGGTLMTIYGSNLGRRFKDVEDSVLVADVSCEVIESEYVVSKRIVCKTGQMDSQRIGNVIVSIGNGAVQWIGSFTYQNPEVYSIHPRLGPVSGGTLVTIRGRELNTGRDILVRMKNSDCPVLYVNDTTITCETSRVERNGKYEVVVMFDDASKDGDLFNYTPDPIIENLFPLSAFVSGGRMIQVFGLNFLSIQQPIMRFHHHSGNKSSQCNIHSDDVILCPVPPLSIQSPSSLSSLSSSSPVKRHLLPMEYSISFSMDGVESVNDLQKNFPNIPSVLTVHPDPVFDLFEEGRRVYKGEALMLTGMNLNLACEPSEVKVTIGNETCRVNTLDSTALYCTPPHVQPLPLDSDVTNLPKVKVAMGNLLFHLGDLEYQRSEVLNSDLWITGVAVGGGFLLTIIVVILIIYRHKSSRAHRQFRKLNMQLDVLESNIRNECKQAFAELQTEVSDFTSDLNAVGIPHRDYRTFISKVLTPYEDTSHFFLQTNGHHKVSINDEGIVRFIALLSQPQFITNFIQTLEQQKSFTIIDKVRVASLLSIIFHDRLDYLTRILKMLLGDLIKKTISGNHPKLMLRRTESVVEKLLSNWLSMCLYDDLKGDVGRCLFMLYKAIKHQMFKGPVDCLTHEAKYSLSEDKLLREKIEAQTITVYVSRPPDMGESIPCKLLDCDTISQAKEKLLDAIYRNAPFSCRPSVVDLDLEWPSSHRSLMVLRDEDATTIVMKGWKQMNTVGHYGVHDKAVLQLSPRMLTFKNSFDGFKDQNNGTLKHSLRIPILAKEDPCKQFHLVSPNTEVNPGNHRPKVMSEIYLTRLLATKFTLQQYVDDLFRSILRADTKQTRCIKWLFDFFDDSASSNDITDPQVVHTWKSNSLLLRFWVNILKNPEFVFDIHKPPIVDSCLSVITQTFMDSCSTHDQKLGKDSPSSKLLFAKDIPRYRKLVIEFYNEIRNLPRTPEDDLLNILALKSKQHACDLSGRDSLQQLYNYAVQYRIELLESLDDDPTARRLNLASQLETIQSYAERDQIYC